MQWDHDQLYQALISRDARFDGHFFTGVTTTGIYCRAICPAVKPKRENVQFYTSATAAEQQGFRPCLRCRPDTIGKETDNDLLQHLLQQVEKQLPTIDVSALAQVADKSTRSIERLFHDELSCAPAEYIRTRRLHLSRKLLRESPAPVTTIAFAAGFASVRAFNDAFKKQYQHTPTEFRRQQPTTASALTVPYSDGYCWDDMVDFLDARTIGGVESVSRENNTATYQRFLKYGDQAGVISVTNNAQKGHLNVTIPESLWSYSPIILVGIREVFDTHFDPKALALFSTDALFAPVFAQHHNCRVPGTWNRFELIIRAILGQFVSVAAARRLCERLVEHYSPLQGEGLQRQFPQPEQLVGADLRQIGTTQKRSEYITGIAKKICDGELDLDSLHGVDGEKTLLKLYGVGPWTASYISMRGLKHPDAFPAGDLVLRKTVALLQTGQDKELPSQKEMEQISQAWRPWRAYAALMLWRYWSAHDNAKKG